MENMNDIKFFEVERPKIPQALVDATYETMLESQAARRRGIFSEDKSTDEDHSSSNRGGAKKKKTQVPQPKSEPRRGRRRKAVEEEDEEEEKPYRAHGERRGGFLIIGDQHRFGMGAGKDTVYSYLYPDAPPIDFSFSLLSTVEEITATGESPNTKRNYKFPEKTEDERYKTSSVRLSYNLLENIDGILAVLYKVIDGGPLGLMWIDLSFNHISTLDDDTLSQLPNLKILYLHGNSIADMTEIPKLQVLPLLYTLTLHGNPIEEEEGYRPSVLHYLPKLRHLDFTGVTKGDRATSQEFGKSYEPYWQRKHVELENTMRQMQAEQEISYTEKLMKEEEDEEDVDFKNHLPAT